MKRRSSTITKEEALSQFITEKKAQGLTERSVEGYEEDINKLLSKVETLSDITQRFLTSLVNEMLETKKPVTVNHYLRCYRAFIYWCMGNNYIEPYKIKLVKCQEAPIKVYSAEDIYKLTEKPRRTESYYVWRTWACISFALGTGARAGTIVNIKLEDIDLNRKEVVYRHTKNKKSTVIPLCDNLVKVLRYYINEFDIKDYMFPNNNNEILNVRALNTAAKTFCKNRGVEFKSFHAFRHTYAREFIVNGGNPFQLQRMLDHQSLNMSQHYAHLFATDLHDAVNDYSPLSKIITQEKVKRKQSWCIIYCNWFSEFFT